MRVLRFVLLSALLMGGCLQPDNGSAEEEEPTCGPQTTLAESWESKPFGLYSAQELVSYLAGRWESSAEWSDGQVTEAEIAFSDSGEGLKWVEYRSPSSGIAPHMCEPKGTFLLEATVTVPARGWDFVIPLNFLTVPNMGPGWSGSGSTTLPDCAGGACVAILNITLINDLSGGWTGTLSYSSDSESLMSGPLEWSR